MSDLADQNTIAAAQRENTGVTSDILVRTHDGHAASTDFSHFAERVLPTLKQLRQARRLAEMLDSEQTSLVLQRIGSFALESIRSIDATLRMTGVYDLSELVALESDAVRMNAVCRVLDEVGERLRALARQVTQQLAHAGDASATAQVGALLSVLNAPPKIGADGLDSA